MTTIANPSVQKLSKEAQDAYQIEEFALSARKYQDAAAEAARMGDELTAAEMANNRSVALLKGGDAVGAYEAARGTDQVFQHAGDARRQAIALGNQASALEALKKPSEAMPLYQQAADLFKGLGENEMRGIVLKSMSYLQFRTGKRFEAMATMRAALDGQKHLSLRELVLKSLLGIVFRLMGGK